MKCGQIFDRDKTEFIEVAKQRYAHKNCPVPQNQTQEDIDKEKLEKYIMNLLQIDYINPRVRKQINQYINEYHYTYSGILKSLIYFYDIKKNSIDKSNGGIGIVPYIYDESYRYYYSLWEAQQKNSDKNISDYIPRVEEITIPSPKCKIKRRKLFSFLDKENDN